MICDFSHVDPDKKKSQRNHEEGLYQFEGKCAQRRGRK